MSSFSHFTEIFYAVFITSIFDTMVFLNPRTIFFFFFFESPGKFLKHLTFISIPFIRNTVLFNRCMILYFYSKLQVPIDRTTFDFSCAILKLYIVIQNEVIEEYQRTVYNDSNIKQLFLKFNLEGGELWAYIWIFVIIPL